MAASTEMPGQRHGVGAWRWPGSLILAMLLVAPLAAHAALFDDQEARRQIGELRAQTDLAQRAVEERLAKLEAAIRDKKPLLDLAVMVEGLKGEIASLRGQNEVLLHRTETLERRQRDQYVELEGRLRKLEQDQAALQEKLLAPERDAARAKEAYEAALNQLKENNFGAAIAAFEAFISAHPESELLPGAQYWIGNAYYALRDYKAAIAAQQKVLAKWPDSAKAPDAMLNIASSQAELGNPGAARATLQDLIKKYPASPSAAQAKQRLDKR